MFSACEAIIKAAMADWLAIPLSFWSLLVPLSWMVLTTSPGAYLLKLHHNLIERQIDRMLLNVLFSVAFYKLLFVVLTAVGIPVTAVSFWVTTSLVGAGAWSWQFAIRKHDHASITTPRGCSGLAALALLLIIFIAGSVRFDNTLRFPEHLMGADSYRHYPRTEWIVQTGRISPTDPWLEGDVPVFEAQGCYVLAAYLSRVTGLESWMVWKYGSVLMGTLSLMSVYLLGAYFLPGRTRPFAGIMAAILLASLPVHVWRTNTGFSEAWALPLIPVAMLSLLWSVRFHSIGSGLLFGLFFTAAAWSNMIPPLYLLFFLVPWCGIIGLKALTYDLIKAIRASALKTWAIGWTRTVSGLLAGVALFMGFLLLWDHTYARIPLLSGAGAHGGKASEGLLEAIKEFHEERRQYYQLRYRDIAEGAHQDAITFKREQGLFAYHAARFMGGFSDDMGINYFTHYMQEYITWPALRWGLISLLFLIAMSSIKSWRERVMHDEPNAPASTSTGWFEAITLLALSTMITLTQYIWLDNLVALGMPPFQSKGYRFLLMPAYLLSLVMALGLEAALRLVARSLENWTGQRWFGWCFRATAFTIAFFLVTAHASHGVYHGWKPLYTAPEKRTLDWAMKHLPENSVIICEWFQADFVRTFSLQTKRPITPVFSRIRPEIKDSMNRTTPPLMIPELQSIDEALDYAAKHPHDNFYIMESRYGTGWQPAGDFRLKPLYYAQHKEFVAGLWALPDNPNKVEPALSSVIPFGGAEWGEARNLNRLIDGTVGDNGENDPAHTHDQDNKGPYAQSHEAWFGLHFGQQREVDGVRAYFGWYKRPSDHPGRRRLHPLMFVPSTYTFQYRNAEGAWMDIPGASASNNMLAFVTHEWSEPIITDAVRVYMPGQRNMMGRNRGGVYRAAVLELNARLVGEKWSFLDGLAP